MKIFALFLILLSFISCREEIASFGDLTADEQDALRARGVAKCRSENSDAYDRFKSTSNEIFSSSDYDRGDRFTHTYKLGTTVVRTIQLKVWKREAATKTIYFYVTDEPESGPVDNYFLKITGVENSDMIDDLLDDHCTKFYVSSISSYGPLTVKNEFNKDLDSGWDNYIDTYTFPFTGLAYFGKFHLSRIIIKKNSEGTEVSRKSYTTTLTTDTEAFDSSNYLDYTQNFCEIDFTTGEPYRLLQDGGYGFSANNCQSTLPGTWSL